MPLIVPMLPAEMGLGSPPLLTRSAAAAVPDAVDTRALPGAEPFPLAAPLPFADPFAGAGVGAGGDGATAGAGEAAPPVSRSAWLTRKPTMERRVLFLARSSTRSSSWSRLPSSLRPISSASSARISMRLMESMDRSASTSRSGSSMSVG